MPEAASNSEPLAGPVLPVFGEIPAGRVLAQDPLFVVVHDLYPLTPGHSLIVPRRKVARFSDLTSGEKARLLRWVEWAQRHLAETLAPPPQGYTLGMNDGEVAGQTVAQFHFHVIPRYLGDVPEPRGGIRWVIPAKARYW